MDNRIDIHVGQFPLGSNDSTFVSRSSSDYGETDANLIRDNHRRLPGMRYGNVTLPLTLTNAVRDMFSYLRYQQMQEVMMDTIFVIPAYSITGLKRYGVI